MVPVCMISTTAYTMIRARIMGSVQLQISLSLRNHELCSGFFSVMPLSSRHTEDLCGLDVT